MHIWALLKNNANTRRESFPLILVLFYFTASNSKEWKVPDHSLETLGVPYIDSLLPDLELASSPVFLSPFRQPPLSFSLAFCSSDDIVCSQCHTEKAQDNHPGISHH